MEKILQLLTLLGAFLNYMTAIGERIIILKRKANKKTMTNTATEKTLFFTMCRSIICNSNNAIMLCIIKSTKR